MMMTMWCDFDDVYDDDDEERDDNYDEYHHDADNYEDSHNMFICWSTTMMMQMK